MTYAGVFLSLLMAFGLTALPAHAGRVITVSSGANGAGGLPVYVNQLRDCKPGDFNNPLSADRCSGLRGAGFSQSQADALAASLGWAASPAASYEAVRQSFTTALPAGTAFSFRYTNDPAIGGAITTYLDPSVSDGNWVVALSGSWGDAGSKSPWSAYYAFSDLSFGLTVSEVNPSVLLPATLGFSLNLSDAYKATTNSFVAGEFSCPQPGIYAVVGCEIAPEGTFITTVTTSVNMINGLTVDEVTVLRYAVPEPGTWALGLMALIGWVGVRRRLHPASQPAARARA
jgi:hypothetical protein